MRALGYGLQRMTSMLFMPSSKVGALDLGTSRRIIHGDRVSAKSWISTATCCGSAPTSETGNRWESGSMERVAVGRQHRAGAGNLQTDSFCGAEKWGPVRRA